VLKEKAAGIVECKVCEIEVCQQVHLPMDGKTQQKVKDKAPEFNNQTKS